MKIQLNELLGVLQRMFAFKWIVCNCTAIFIYKYKSIYARAYIYSYWAIKSVHTAISTCALHCAYNILCISTPATSLNEIATTIQY